MVRRLQLHSELVDLIGNKNVYYQPPESLKLNYPCIMYRTEGGRTEFADDRPYIFQKEYTITYITRDPDSDLVKEIAMAFPTITFDRVYITEGLNHYVYSLFY